jgi:transposase
MLRTLLTDAVWNKIERILPGKVGDRGRTAANNRWFIEAVLWIGRTGSPWRDLPTQFGRWHTVYMRFSRWRRKGVWQRIALEVSGISEIEQVMMDSTIIRAHQHSAGARRKHGPQAIGRSRGGLTTKLHLAIDSTGRPLRLIITEGQVADISCANDLIENLPAKSVIADKGYDADALVQAIRAAGARAVIPPRSNRVSKRRYSRREYRTRNLVERFFNRIKHFRRVATRYDKLADSYLAFASLACVFGPVAKM